MTDLDRFTEWLNNEQTISTENVKIGFFEETGRGIMATKDINEGDDIMVIEREGFISLANPYFGQIWAERFAEKKFEQRQDVVLAIIIMHEQSKLDSPWRPYLKLLEDNAVTCTMALNWNENQISMLQGCAMYESVNSLRNSLRDDYENMVLPFIAKHSAYFSNTSFELYRWALSLVLSRSFDLSALNVKAMVPLADMANHFCYNGGSMSVVQRYFDRATNKFHLQSSVPYRQGDEVFNTYGFSNDADFLLNYGFLFPDTNVNDVRRIKISALQYDASLISQKKLSLIGKMDISTDSFLVRFGEVPSQFLRLLTIYLMDDEQFDAYVNCGSLGGLGEPAIDDLSDKAATLAISIIDDALSRFATSYVEDCTLLECASDPIERLAIRYRMTEKELLFSAREYFAAK